MRTSFNVINITDKHLVDSSGQGLDDIIGLKTKLVLLHHKHRIFKHDSDFY